MTQKKLARELQNLEFQQKKINERKEELTHGLPHLYGWKWYGWARHFFESKNSMNLLCAANQISKSSTQIRKGIHWATAPKLWPELWPNRKAETKIQFWYLYPSQEVASLEFENKWVPEFMPRGKYKDDPVYGWKAEYDKGDIKAVHFNSGVSLYFKFYSQSITNLQTATIHSIFCDEELPEEHYAELAFRLTATDGYFHMVFTATLNQPIWHRAMEEKGEAELFPDASKQQISMYDCTIYDDGSPGPWTEEKINRAKARCQSPSEVQRRIYGRFITEVGRKFGAFSAARHFIKPKPTPTNTYRFYAGVDVGSGGEKNHPAAIVFLAVHNEFKHGFVIRGWRGDGVVTTSADILEKFKELRGSLRCTMQCYDWQAKDFSTIAARQGESFVKAEKGQEIGEDIINTLFKNDMLHIFDIDDLQPLGGELSSLLKTTPKTKAKDDFCDALRYAATRVPWDFTAVKGFVDENLDRPEVFKPMTPEEYLAWEIDQRRGTVEKTKEEWSELEDDFAYWNEEYGS